MYAGRRVTMLGLLFVVAMVLAWRSYVVSADEENVLRAELYTALRTPVSLSQLSEHMSDLERMANSIDNYSLADIRETIRRTSALVEGARKEIRAQQSSWAEISELFKEDAQKFEKLRQELETVQKLNSEEMVRVRNAIASAEQPSLYERFQESLWAFFLGIASSLGAVLAIHWLSKYAGDT